VGGRKRDCFQRKQLTQVWGVRLPGGCLTSASGGPRCPGAAGHPRWDLPSLHGKELGTGTPHSGPCTPVPASRVSDPCIPVLASLHPACQSSPLSLRIPHPAALIPASRFPATRTTPHPDEAQPLLGGLRVVQPGKSLELRSAKRFADRSQRPGEGRRVGGGRGLSHVERTGRVQGDPCSRQLGGGADRKGLDHLEQSSCVQMLPRGSCSLRGRL